MHHTAALLCLGIAVSGAEGSPTRVLSRGQSCDSDACKELAATLAKSSSLHPYDAGQVCNNMDACEFTPAESTQPTGRC